MRSRWLEPRGELEGHTLRLCYPSMSPTVVARVCPVCGGTPPSSRSIYCKPACKQLAYRLRRQAPHETVDSLVFRKQLQRQRKLVAHTVYECARCGERLLGERRCPDCNLYGRSVGLGGGCPDCDSIILLTDLLGLDVPASFPAHRSELSTAP
jgi:hypothetical protein